MKGFCTDMLQCSETLELLGEKSMIIMFWVFSCCLELFFGFLEFRAQVSLSCMH